MIRTIFLDFGNVVSFFDHQRAIGQLSRFTDLPPTELGLILYGSPLEADYECGQITTAEYLAAARADGHLRCSDAEFLAAYSAIFWPNPAVIGLLPRLSTDYRLILASNTNEAHCTRFREQFADVLEHFDHLVVSHEARSRKPHREFFTYCQKFADCAPAECLFVDDLPSNIAAARAFGWQGIVYEAGMDLVVALRTQGVDLSAAEA